MTRRASTQTREDRLLEDLFEPMHILLTGTHTLENLEYMKDQRKACRAAIRQYRAEVLASVCIWLDDTTTK